MEKEYSNIVRKLLGTECLAAIVTRNRSPELFDRLVVCDEVQQAAKIFVTEISKQIGKLEQQMTEEKSPVEVCNVTQDEKAALSSKLITPSGIRNLAPLPPGAVPLNVSPPIPPLSALEQSRTTFTVSANGKVNVDFRARIEGKSASGKTVVICDVIIPENLGLKFDAEKSELSGIPLLAGDFHLKVSFQFDPTLPDDPLLHHGECVLIVNPDPKTLWKNLESDRNDPYRKEDEVTQFIAGEDGLSMVVASKRGRAHAHVGSFRDDDFCLLHDKATGWRVMTVADGAGSARLSRQGSLIASHTVLSSVATALGGERGQKLDEAVLLLETDVDSAQKQIQDQLYYLFGNAAKEAVHAIEGKAKSTGALYKDFSTTLILTIHKKVAAGHFIAAYWVGDGGVGVYRQGEEVKVLGKADSGEFAGQTRFLDAAMLDPQEIINRMKVTIVPDFTAVIAMTDGITDPKFETDANIENCDKWGELWDDLSQFTEAPVPDAALLDWLDFWSPGNHDDRTIAILYPAKSNAETPPEVAA